VFSIESLQKKQGRTVIDDRTQYNSKQNIRPKTQRVFPPMVNTTEGDQYLRFDCINIHPNQPNASLITGENMASLKQQTCALHLVLRAASVRFLILKTEKYSV